MYKANGPTFKERLNTLRVQHAVVQGGQGIFLLVFTTLFKGTDLTDIKAFVVSQLPSNRKYKDSFTKPEQDKLDIGDYKDWDISLLFKLFRIVCGLHPNVSEWKSLGRDTLEKLLDELKDLRNESAHDLNSILTKEERNAKLEELRKMCIDILIKLGEKAPIGEKAIYEHIEFIESIIEDVQREINEGSAGNMLFVQSASAAGAVSKSAFAAGAVSKSASAAAVSPAFGFAAGSVASASASASGYSSKGGFAAAACADSVIAGGFRPAAASHGDYHHDGGEPMDTDDIYKTNSWETSIIEQLKSNILKYAGLGWITV